MVGDLINGEIPDHWEFTTLGEICRHVPQPTDGVENPLLGVLADPALTGLAIEGR